MKGMQQIKRGSGFRGVVSYALDNDNGEQLGQVIGGNMSGTSVKELSAEFGVSRKVRPDIKKPVWHNSLRLPEGEKLTEEKWTAIADDYMSRMGFSDKHPRVYILHDDKKGQHIHIVASRVALDGQLYLGKNENLISTQHIQALERDHQLTLTKGPSVVDGRIVMPDLARPKAGEVGKYERTGEAPERFALAALIDTAIAGKPTATAFAERLVMAGVEVRANFRQDSLNGFSFSFNGIAFKGSQLGKQYTGKALFDRGLSYVKDRDHAPLRQLCAAAAGSAERGRLAENDRAPGSGPDREIDTSHSGNSRDLRRVDGPGARNIEPGLGADDVERAGRSERSEYGDRESRRAVDEVDHHAEAGRPGAKATAGTEASGERPSTDRHHRAASPDIAGDGGGTAEISTGIDISDAGFIRTGDKGSDELLSAAHKNRLRGERERMAADRKKWAGHGENVKNTLAALRRPYAAQLSRAAYMSQDATAYRVAEIKSFANALDVKKLQIVCTKPGEKTVKTAVTLDLLEKSSALKSMASLSARHYTITVQPAADSGLVVLKGLDAQSLEKLEAMGLGAAVAVDVAGKKEAWINVGSSMSANERSALTQRLSALVQADPKTSAAGRLPGFAGATTAARTGTIASAAAEHLGEIKSELFEAKTAQQLAKLVDKNAVLKPAQDIQKIGSIPTLRSGWLGAKVAAVRDDMFFWKQKPDPAQVERAVVSAMGRQKVPPEQAFRAVLEDSAVGRGDAQHAAQVVAQEYTRNALTEEGAPEVDLDAEAQKRFPELYKRAESGVDAERKREAAERAQGAQLEQQRLNAEAEQKREALLAKQTAERLENGRDHSPTLGR